VCVKNCIIHEKTHLSSRFEKNHKTRSVSLSWTLGLETKHHTPWIQEAQIRVISIEHGATLVLSGDLVEHYCDVHVLTYSPVSICLVAICTAEGEMVVGNAFHLTLRHFGVVIELYIGESLEDVAIARNIILLPAQVRCAIETEHGSQAPALCELDGLGDVLVQVCHKRVTIFEEVTSLALASFLDLVSGLAPPEHAATSCGVKASPAATISGPGAGIVARDITGSEVEDEAEIAQLGAFLDLGIGCGQ